MIQYIHITDNIYNIHITDNKSNNKNNKSKYKKHIHRYIIEIYQNKKIAVFYIVKLYILAVKTLYYKSH